MIRTNFDSGVKLLYNASNGSEAGKFCESEKQKQKVYSEKAVRGDRRGSRDCGHRISPAFFALLWSDVGKGYGEAEEMGEEGGTNAGNRPVR